MTTRYYDIHSFSSSETKMCKSRIWHIPYDQSIEFMTKEINYEKLCSDCMKSLEKRELSKKNEMQKKNKRWF